MSYIPQPRAPGGPPQFVRVLAFLGWLIVPIALTAGIVLLTDIFVLWWGLIWFGLAVIYTIMYFKWAKKKYPKPGS